MNSWHSGLGITSRGSSHGVDTRTPKFMGVIARMHVQGHSWMAQQYHMEAKALRAWWMAITDFNHWSVNAHKAMPFMQELACIFAPQETDHTFAYATNRGSPASLTPCPDAPSD